jgi:hypothetical protein
MKLVAALLIGALAVSAEQPAFKNGQKMVAPKRTSGYATVKDYKPTATVEGLNSKSTAMLQVKNKVRIDKNVGLSKKGYRRAELVKDLSTSFSHLKQGESKEGKEIGTVFVETGMTQNKPEKAPGVIKNKQLKAFFNKASLAYEKEFEKHFKNLPHPSKYMNTILLERPVDASLGADTSMITPYESITPATLNTNPANVAAANQHLNVVAVNPPGRPDGLPLVPYMPQDGALIGTGMAGYGGDMEGEHDD